MCPSVLVREKVDLASYIPVTTLAALRDETVHMPTGESATRPVSAGLSFPRQLTRQLTSPVMPPPSYENAVPIYRYLRNLRNWVRVLDGIGISLALIGDTLFAKLLMRSAVSLGRVVIGPEVPWLSWKSLILFWCTDICVFRFFRIHFGIWILSLLILDWWPGGYSLLVSTLLEFFLAITAYCTSGFLKGITIAVQNAVA
jgi:hypothetical protein